MESCHWSTSVAVLMYKCVTLIACHAINCKDKPCITVVTSSEARGYWERLLGRQVILSHCRPEGGAVSALSGEPTWKSSESSK